MVMDRSTEGKQKKRQSWKLKEDKVSMIDCYFSALVQFKTSERHT